MSLKGLLAVSETGRISNNVYLILQFQLLQILEQAKPLLLFIHKHISSSLIYCTYSWTNKTSWVGNTARTLLSLSQRGFNHWPRREWSHPAKKPPHRPTALPTFNVKAFSAGSGGAEQPAGGRSQGLFPLARKGPAKSSQAIRPSEHSSAASLSTKMNRFYFKSSNPLFWHWTGVLTRLSCKCAKNKSIIY